MKVAAFFICGLMTALAGCDVESTKDEAWWKTQMALYRTAHAVTIEYCNPATSNSYERAVTNEADLAMLRDAIPESYMRKAKHFAWPDGYNPQFIAVAYPYSGTLTTNGKAYPATCVFISTNGLVYHGRGNLRDDNWHGLMVPQYKAAAYHICVKYGIPADKMKDFQPAAGDYSPAAGE